MANTIHQNVIDVGSKKITNQFTLVSDGSEQTNFPVYTSADHVARNNIGGIYSIKGCVTILDATATDVSVKLFWDANTDELALSLPINHPFEFDFKDIGILLNTSGSTSTGNLLLTTTGLESGDAIWFVLEMSRSGQRRTV